MSVDNTDLRAFYASPLGTLARRYVGRAVAAAWGNLHGLSVMGLGYTLPFRADMEGRCGRLLTFVPGAQGLSGGSGADQSACALVDPLTMPLADGCIDRILAVHAIEATDAPSEFLHEVGRLLTPSGRLLLVCPNRRGLWARMDRTPFGFGQPYSRSQLRHLLRSNHFAPESWTETLYVPPFRNRLMLRGASAWEFAGRFLALPFAGLHVVEAAKQIHRPVPVAAPRRTRRRRPVLVSATPGRAVACDTDPA